MPKSLLVLVVVTAAFAGQYDLLVCHCDTGSTSKVEDNIGSDPFYDSVDYIDCATTTPTVATMLNYGCVFTWSNDPYSDPTAMGDNLADYMDGGGGVLSCAFAHYASDFICGLSGRYVIDENYCPLTLGWHNFDFESLGDYDPHPIMEGVLSISDIYYWQDITIETPATWVADLANGSIFVAVNTARNAVGINFYPGDFSQWTGDGWVLLNNAIQYLMEGGTEDLDPPYVAGMDPEDGAEGVPVDTAIVFHCKDYISGVDTDTIDFTVRSTTLRPGSACVSSASAVGVEPVESVAISGVLAVDGVDPLDVVCTFTPDEDLPSDAVIICVVDDKLADLSGNEMGYNFIWTFSTVGIPQVERTTWGAIKAEF
ncbi:MAG: Ig-like domain-containing protein [bacterium]|nr:Ig-like domain-containing protein [bacterium]